MNHKIIPVLLTTTLLMGCMVKAPVETATEETTAEETAIEVSLEAITEPTEEETTETSTLGMYNWIIEDLSPEEVVDTCFFIFNSSTQIIGKTVPECYEYLGHEAIGNNTFPMCNFVANIGNQGLEFDSVGSIYYQTAQIQMDNTIFIPSNEGNCTYIEWTNEDGTLQSGYSGLDTPIWYWTQVSLCIKDYDKAVTIYDLMLQSGNYANNIISDERTGTDWVVTAFNPMGEYEAVTMQKIDTYDGNYYYYITFHYVEIL